MFLMPSYFEPRPGAADILKYVDHTVVHETGGLAGHD